MHRTRRLLLSIACVLCAPATLTALYACQSTPSDTSAHHLSRLSGDWNLSTLWGQSVASRIPAGMRVPSLSITSDGHVGGTGGINRMATNLDTSALTKGDLELSPIISTKMAGSPEAMAFEGDFFKALEEATAYRVNGDTLTLSGPSGELMTLARAR